MYWKRDKEPCKIHATCSIHMACGLVGLTILDPNFCIVGVHKTPKGASRYVLRETLRSVAEAGILSMANDQNLWPQSLLTVDDVNTNMERLMQASRVPSAFMLMKWKTVGTENDWKRRLFISHALHPLRRFSKEIGRCLTVLLKELHCAFPFWGTPSVRGVRDIWSHLHRAPPRDLTYWERDIDNAYWNLDKEAVEAAVKQAALLVRKHQNMRGDFMFAIAKGSLLLLDRIGTATGKNYRVFSLEQVTHFVHWDLHANTLFAVWGVVLQQSECGVPIGGFISAQLMCL